MPFSEWLKSQTLENFLQSGYARVYDEITVVDRNGEELSAWIDNDPKYKAKVLNVYEYESAPWAIEVVIDWLVATI